MGTLTMAALNAANPKDVLRDASINGLHARGKRFYLYFRTKDGRERRPKLGEYPVMSLAQARQVAKDMLVQVATGKDPVADRRATRDAATLGDAVGRFEREHLSRRKSGAWVMARLFGPHLSPALLGRPVADIEYDDIHALHSELAATPYLANRLLSHLSTLFGKCEVWKYRLPHTNPCRGVEPFPERKRRRYMAPDEAAAVSRALDAEMEANAPSVAFIYLLILTGARKGEIAAARWEWIRDGVLHLPDSKTGAKPVFLPPAAVNILETLPRTSGTITGIKDPTALWRKVRTKAGCPDLRLHDLRHSFASAAISAGLTLDQIGELLGHASTQTTKRYAHLVDATAQAAAARTADAVSAMFHKENSHADR